MALLLITHDLGIVRKMADRVCVMTDGRDRRDRRRRRAIFEPPAAPVHPPPAGGRAGGRWPAPPPADAPVVMDGRATSSVWFPIKRGLLRRTVGHVKAVDGVEPDACARARRSASSANRLRQDHAGPGAAAAAAAPGRIRFAGRDIQGLPARALRPLRREMQIVFQDPYGSLSPAHVGRRRSSAKGSTCTGSAPRRASAASVIAQALREVGLDPALPRPLSARVLRRPAPAHRHRARHGAQARASWCSTSRPRALDMSVQAQIVDLLRDLQARHDLAYLFISHDLKVVRALADEVLVMQRRPGGRAGSDAHGSSSSPSRPTRAR